jgi:DNA-binding transcriptional MerR regulator
VASPDAALAVALAGPLPGEEEDGDLLTLDELAQRAQAPRPLLHVIERSGLLVPRMVDGKRRYSAADAAAVRAGLALVEAGVPLGDLLDLARRHDVAMRGIAEQAVDLFARFVRDPIHGSARSDLEASERLVAAFRDMLPAVSTIVAHHFRRLLVAAARARLERDDRQTGHEP